MSITFLDESYENNFKSLKGLIKSNNGFFKSAKQRDYLRKHASSVLCYGKKELKSDDHKVIEICAEMRWADYGSRSYRRVEWQFVVDSYGIVAQFKLHFNYDGYHSTPSDKIDLVWKRDTSIELPVFEEPIITESKFIGTIGVRSEFVATVKSSIAAGTNFMGQTLYLTKLVTDSGDHITYWNLIPVMQDDGYKYSAQEGQKIKFHAMVKDHSEFRGIKQTVISRVTKQSIVN